MRGVGRRTHGNAQGFKRVSVTPGGSAAIRVGGIEGLRGIAAILVITVHVWTNMGTDGTGLGPGMDDDRVAWFFGNIDIVVDLFFVLSGLLLWLPFARAALDDSARIPDGRDFLFRRVLRFIPLYWVVVVICWFTRNFGVATADWSDLLLHLSLLHAFDSDTIFYTLGPAWTLSVEWIFYLTLAFVGPSFVRWVREGGSEVRRVARMAGPFCAVVWISIMFKANVAAVWGIPVDHWAWRYGPVAKADTFVIGMAAAVVVVLVRGRRLPGVLLPALVALGAAVYWPAAVPPGADHNLHAEVVRHTLAALGFAIVLLAVMTTRWTFVQRAIDNRALLRLSLLTYSLYLVHEPVLLVMVQLGLVSTHASVLAFLLNLALVLLLVVPIGWVAHRLVEEPWTDMGALRDRQGRRRELYPDVVHHVPVSDLARTALAGPLRDSVLPPVAVAAPVPAASEPATTSDDREKEVA